MNERSQMPAINPADALPKQWVLSSLNIQERGLTVESQSQSPCGIELPGGLTHHILVYQLNQNPRRINRIDNQEYDGLVRSGEFLLIPASAPAFGYWEDTKDKILRFIINPSFLSKTAEEIGCSNADKVEILPILKRRDRQIKSIARSFLKEINSNHLGSRLYTESLTNLFLVHLLRHYCSFKPKLKQYQGGLNRDRLNTAIDYIQAHLDEKLTLDAIARQLNISQYHFCDLFKQSMGIPAYKYVIQQRVERAKQLLRKKPEKAIVEIALECGFANQTHFHKHFRKHTGMTPKRYREH